MSRIHIERSHQLDPQTLKGLVDEVAVTLEREYALNWHWAGQELVFRRSGARGRLVPAADRLTITLELGLLLRPFSMGISDAIEQRLDELLS
ncbi:polyhydroxyalkanoic acid system family protein [Ferrimonas marina]|uniref:Putative polyhydroxyalkanoic acid system protein n=1 Tax=Ferrimonas marina TaxID=299255 RepID=A0A1M5ZTR9_9GAMM|nr:polyhydroxyalkanoic acid system family protein [Ferrimonas marina]SHI27499.1 putative polyhydroxyalkanoic acid system protein [Ferrimonas marina]